MDGLIFIIGFIGGLVFPHTTLWQGIKELFKKD
jgi:hypothetical protein